jgi:hypothetical protein
MDTIGDEPDALPASVRQKLDGLKKCLASLGRFAELDEQWRRPWNHSRGAAAKAIEDVRALRAQIQDLLEQPRCSYDGACSELLRALLSVPADRRRAVRRLVGDAEHIALIPCTQRSPWLALEEQSSARLLVGLIAQALVFPDQDDYRDVMVALAPARVCAAMLGVDAAALFDDAATFAGEGVSDTFHSFGRRETSLGAFGWRQAVTPHGVRFRSTF